jgi:glutamate dehydrogenase
MESRTTLKSRMDEILHLLSVDAEGDGRDVMEGFASRLLGRASSDFLESRSTEWLADEVRAVFELLEGTPPSETAVTVEPLPGRPQEFGVLTVMEDRPFIVDTIREFLHGEGFSVVQLLHPVIRVERADDGRVLSLDAREGEGRVVSVTCTVVAGSPERSVRERLRDELEDRLEKVRQVTEDFDAMMERADAVRRDLEGMEERFPWRRSEFQEIRELLDWLQDGNFVFLGYREYDMIPDDGGRAVRVRSDSGLGILRDEERSRFAEPVPASDLAPDLRARALAGPLLIFSKTNSESPVHRRARMDYVGVKKLDPAGEVAGERRFLGLLTAGAYSQDPSQIPILRRKLREILEAEGTVRGSHDYSLIHRIFNSMPKEELFLSTVPELLRAINEVMEAEGAGEIRVSARPDPLGRGVNVMVILPAAKFSGEIRRQIQAELVRTYEGRLLNYHLAMGGGEQARLHFYLDSDLRDVETVDVGALEERVRASARSWEERLADALKRRYEPVRAQELTERHRGEFSAEYRATMDVDTAVEDVASLERLEESGRQQVVLEHLDGPDGTRDRLKIFATRGRLVLSDVMPILENLGYRVLEADRYDVGKPGPHPATIHTFHVDASAGRDGSLGETEARVADALLAVQEGLTEDDRLNSLVLSAGLEWWQVALLRAYANYAFRVGTVSSRVAVRKPLIEYPECARCLFQVFEARHWPDDAAGPAPTTNEAGGSGRASTPRGRLAAFRACLEDVRGIEDDRALRGLLELIQATVRTNFFQERARDRRPPALALKFDCGRIESMVRPRPHFEVYVNSADTEGAHLRMGPVARGGIRWSDRTEDFRVEVLGLVKTQQVKNAVIVPAGAKGAFVARDLPEDPEERRAAGVRSYRQFIRALLDVTDNIRADEIVPPPQTRLHDGTDPYLVVAADKGTATLSDTANELAAEYDFWLGDAFASGGTHGYDHKKLGITARGAWECVERHFRELGQDMDEPFSVVGIGDMSGDVFGNGMLLSRQIRLKAAFDHRHVFLDPDPDPEASYRERRRLFEMSSSTWEDYDREVLSEGGGIYPRDAKSIPLTEPVREWLEVEDEELNGDALIRAILRAPADLLWNGGIGTYVKATGETHPEVGDPANDATRVNGRDLGARVVGEGGNLGFTQQGRVEYALSGGRLNTDALDNSGGVDMSDHEVNLKILLDSAVADGEMTGPERNDLLREIESDVARRVLRHNHLQSLAVSLEEHRTRDHPAEFRETMLALERAGVLDRGMEDLPTSEELSERQEAGSYLTRPELAVLLSHAKLLLKTRLADSDLPRDPALRPLLEGYFPEKAREAAGADRVRGHRLARRIVATRLANLFVDRMGATAVVKLCRETGSSPPEVVRAWYEAYRIGDAGTLYRAVEELDETVPAGVQNRWLLHIGETLEDSARWLLSSGTAERSIEERVSYFAGPVRELMSELPELVTEERAEAMATQRSLHEMDGVDPEVARRLVAFGALDGLLPVARLARESGLPGGVVGRVYFGLTRDLDFPWIQERLAGAAGADVWEQRAAKTLSLRLDEARTRITAKVIEGVDDGSQAEAALEAFRQEHAGELRRIRELLDDVREAESPGLAALMVAVHSISAQTDS